MKEFMLIFRLKEMDDFKPTPEQIQERLNWLAGIAAQNKLVDQGNTLSPFSGSAKTVRPGDVGFLYETVDPGKAIDHYRKAVQLTKAKAAKRVLEKKVEQLNKKNSG